jgi:hypothetical protein
VVSNHVVRTEPVDAATAPGAVVGVDLQLGGEAVQLSLPVAEHRHRAHDQRRTVGRIGQQRGHELSGLAQAHVVGQAGAEPEPTEEGEPADAPLLVGAEPALEALGRRHRRDPGVDGAVQQVGEPADLGSIDAEHIGGPGQLADAEPGPEQLLRRRLLRRGQLGQQRLEPTGIDGHPLAPHPHQRLLGHRRPLERRQVGLGESALAERHTAAGAGADPGSQAQAGPLGPPRREQHGDARVIERAEPLPEQRQHGSIVDNDRGGHRLVERSGQLRRQPGEAAEGGEQRFRCPGPERRAAGEDLGQRHQEARLVRVLGQQLDLPWRPGARRLVDPQAELGLSGHHRTRADPRRHLGGERPQLGDVERRREPRVGRRQRATPRLGDRLPARVALADGGAGDDETAADQPVDGLGQFGRRRPLALRRRVGHQRRHQTAVAGGRERPPPRPGPTVGLEAEAGHDPALLDQTGCCCPDLRPHGRRLARAAADRRRAQKPSRA